MERNNLNITLEIKLLRCKFLEYSKDLWYEMIDLNLAIII